MVLSVCDKTYHTNNGIQQKWEEIKKLRNYALPIARIVLCTVQTVFTFKILYVLKYYIILYATTNKNKLFIYIKHKYNKQYVTCHLYSIVIVMIIKF